MLTVLRNGDSDKEHEVHIDRYEFIIQFKAKWNELHSLPDVFRYKINSLRERIVDNEYILLLNTDRGSKRRTPECIDNVHQPFDPNKFHFNKTSPEEIIFKIKETNDSDVHTLLVNVSPISRYHSLLCPSVEKCLPQVVTEDSLKIALEVKILADDRDLKIGFNSLCGFASVNHLHYHLLFEKHTLHVERAKCTHIKGPLYLIEDIVVPAFCFEVKEETLIQATKDIYLTIEYLLSKSIAHNVLMVSGEPVLLGSECSDVVRVLVTPRKSTAGVKSLTAFNVAVYEFAGCFPVFDSEYFDILDATYLESELLKWKLSNFEELCDKIKSIY